MSFPLPLLSKFNCGCSRATGGSGPCGGELDSGVFIGQRYIHFGGSGDI